MELVGILAIFTNADVGGHMPKLRDCNCDLDAHNIHCHLFCAQSVQEVLLLDHISDLGFDHL